MFKSSTLIITSEEKQRIYATYDRNQKELNEDVEAIKEWLSKQPHLPQNEDDLRIKNMLILNKCSLEKTKKKIDLYYSVKHIVPEIFENREPLHPTITTLMDNLIFFPLPRMTPDCHRVYIFRFVNNDASNFNMMILFKLVFSIFDLRLMCDMSLGDHFIIDFEHAKLGHIVQFTPAMIKKGYTLLEKAYSDRIKGVHFVHLPPAANVVVALITSILSEKLSNRVFVHKKLKSLHQKISKEIIPTQYKGTAGDMNDLYAEWRKYLCSNNSWIKDIGSRKSNEKLRLGQQLDSDIFGMCGSFRKLNVD